MAFKTRFNPIIPFVRILFLSILILAFILIFDELYFSKKNHSLEDHFKIVFGVLFFGVIVWMFGKQLIRTTKTYTFANDYIKEFNFLTFSSRTIPKDHIKGFSTSIIPYRIMNFKQVIIYLKDGTKIDLMQFNFFNFRSIQHALNELNYAFLGSETYKWKWFDDRYYRFDDE